ncbi:MAG: site-specific integrase [Bacteroidota bacterium]
MIATARIYILKSPSRKTHDELCPVRLCVTHNRKRRYFSIKEKIKNDDWLFVKSEDIPRIMCDSPRGKYRDIKFEYDRIVDEARNIINGMSVFSFGKFEDRFFCKTGSWDNIFSAFIDHILRLKSDGRFGYASSFESTIRAVKEFHTKKTLSYSNRIKVEQRYKDYLSGKELHFADINHAWLKKFERWLYEQGKAKSTVGIYMRNIRVLFNLAIKKHKIKADYPFLEYRPKAASGRKLALTAHQVRLIADYETKDPVEIFYRDLFMFSFLSNGMNLADIARLRYSNVDHRSIVFVREKTKNKDHQAELNVPITEQMRVIIDRHSNKAVGHDAYMFPILKPEMSDQRLYMEIKQFTKMLNKHLRNIARSVGINERISSYTARHSWATIAKNSGASTEFIKESLGHSNVLVTENYLKSFEETTKREHSEKIEQQIYSHG